MKHIIALLFICSIGFGQYKQRFQVTYTITVDSLTLEQASKLEDVFRREVTYPKPFNVDIKTEAVRKVGDWILRYDSVSVSPKPNWYWNNYPRNIIPLNKGGNHLVLHCKETVDGYTRFLIS